jgi:hypothetical protein
MGTDKKGEEFGKVRGKRHGEGAGGREVLWAAHLCCLLKSPPAHHCNPFFLWCPHTHTPPHTQALVAEVALDLRKRLTSALANPAVLHFYVWLLQVGGGGEQKCREASRQEEGVLHVYGRQSMTRSLHCCRSGIVRPGPALAGFALTCHPPADWPCCTASHLLTLTLPRRGLTRSTPPG